MSVKADDDDLRVEAARSEYRLECRLRPFTALHRRQVGSECAVSAQEVRSEYAVSVHSRRFPPAL